MRLIKKVFLFILICLINTPFVAQVKSIGTPFIHNYTPANYQAGSQTWDIEQCKNGMMYFANNDGLLEYDGHFWEVYQLPNNSIMRSIKSGNDSTLYAGGFDEFGYYELGKMGGAKFQSLTHLMPEDDHNFGDVWNIFLHPDGVIFQTYSQLMIFKNDTINIIPAPSTFHFSFLVNSEFYVNDIENGLMRYAMGKLHPIIGLEKLKGKEIWGILPINDNLLISTSSEGVFVFDGNSLKPWNNTSNQFLKQNQIFSCLRIDKNLLAFGTIQNGLLICDNNGTPKQHISMEDGLQNNTVLSINLDMNGNLWLGTDHGIDFLEINSPLSLLSNNFGLSKGYAAIVFNDNLYLGTNQGLFTKKFSSIQQGGLDLKEMELVDGTQGQVWTLNEFDGSLFCGHNNGTFIVNGKKVEQIADVPGGWTFLQLPGDPSKIIGGTYSGLILFEKENRKWKYSNQVYGFSESARTLAFDDDGSLWVAHGYKGVFHVNFSKDYDSVLNVNFYNNQNSVLPSWDVSLAKIDDEIVFTCSENIYHFSKEQNSFIPNVKFNKLFNDQEIRKIKEDQKNNFWYFSNKKAGVFRIREDGNFTNISLPFLQLEGMFVSTFELVYLHDNRNVFFGTENGFAHYNPSVSKEYSYPFKTFLRSMRTYQPDSVFYPADRSLVNQVVLDYDNNDIEFLFAANDFENAEKLLYATYLEGYDEDWSIWQSRNTREFTNLDEGDYVFRVKAKNIYGTISEEVSIDFGVLPPFQRSFLAYIIYGVIILLLIILFAYVLKRRLDRIKVKNQKEQEEVFRRKEEKFQREALEAEQKVVRLRNENLRGAMKEKDRELANATMQTLQKNEMLITLRDELKKLSELTNDEGHKHEVKHLVRKINKEIDSENQWKLFETHFESVHEEFLNRIKTAFPDLSPRELKLCAYLRMNVSSKEISLLMNISTRGVEISRYRLRKKLNLSRETNLTEFIMSF